MSEDGREHIERMERQMAFILEQQAQYEVRWAEAAKRWASTEQSIRALLAIAEIHEREFEELRAADKELRAADTEWRQANKELREITKQLGEAGKATDERLNVLINVVERHISEGHNHQRKEQ
jgi:hypothetical protein